MSFDGGELESVLLAVGFGSQRLRAEVQALSSTDMVEVVPRVGCMEKSSEACCCLSGTLAIHYLGTRYNIPFEMQVPRSYPATPPTVYVRPSVEIKPIFESTTILAEVSEPIV